MTAAAGRLTRILAPLAVGVIVLIVWEVVVAAYAIPP